MLSDPVDFSSTAILMTLLSGALPGELSISTFLKKSKSFILLNVSDILEVLNASPSTRRNSRLITSSSVREFPVMFMRSTNTLGPSATLKIISITWFSASRFGFGLTSTKA